MKKNKKVLTIALSIFLLIANMQFSLVYADEKERTNENYNTQVTNSADTTPPTIDINSLKIDKKNVKPGDTVNISFKATDDKSGIKSVYISYHCPNYNLLNNNKSKSLF